MHALLVGLLLALASAAPPPAQYALPNDNRTPAGSLARGVLSIGLDARMSIWRPDGAGGAGIPIAAFAPSGAAAQIPGPLIRVPLGTTVVARVRNSLPGTVLTMHGMVDRPTDRDRAVRIPFGQVRTIRFRAGAPGTYLYWGSTVAKSFATRSRGDSQLGGAFVVDPPGRVPANRVFVITQWLNVFDKKGNPDFDYELDAINGRAWPYTERLTYAKDATVRWHLVNASWGEHPLHLHGFYFTVGSRGDGLADVRYARSDRYREVTELLEPGHTFTMTWLADRPGNWLFHCHFAYHVVHHAPIADMIAGKAAMTGTEYETNFVRHAGMGGLILGLTVKPRPGERLAADPAAAAHLALKIERAPGDKPDAPWFRYDPAILVMTRGVPYAVDITNLLNEPTTVHWHGVELADSYYDGVMDFSGYGNRVLPMIEPGQTFEARVTPPRAGTFIYHTHLDDVWQLRGGLAAPLIVLEPGQQYDPNTDHPFTITTTHAMADALKIFVNGTSAPAALTVHAGAPQRFRFINLTTFWPDAMMWISSGNGVARWTPLAIDGADLPATRRVPESAIDTVTIGETKDFTFTPSAPGDLKLVFEPDPTVPNLVTVPIRVVE